MSSLLSNLVDNLSDGLHGDKYMDCKSYLDYMSVKNNWLIFRFFECRKIITKPLIKNVLKDLRIYEFTKTLSISTFISMTLELLTDIDIELEVEYGMQYIDMQEQIISI